MFRPRSAPTILLSQNVTEHLSGGWDRETGEYNRDQRSDRPGVQKRRPLPQGRRRKGLVTGLPHQLLSRANEQRNARGNDTEFQEVDAGPQATLDLYWGHETWRR